MFIDEQMKPKEKVIHETTLDWIFSLEEQDLVSD